MRTTILIALALAAAPAAALAQNSLPGLENFTLDRAPRPSPTPTPSETPAPAATQVPVPPPAVVPTAVPSPVATPSPRTVRPAATPTPGPSPSVSAPAAQVTPSATGPSPVPTQTAVTPASEPASPAATAGGIDWLVWLGIAALAAVLAGGLWWWQRRRSDEYIWADTPEPEAIPVVAPPPPASVPPPAPAQPKTPGGLITTALRPAAAFDLRPVTVVIDALRATLEFELVVANPGRAPAHELSVESWLIAAGQNPVAEVAALLAGVPGTLLAPPFALPASANIVLPAQTATARELLSTISAGDRKLFVPLLAVRASWRDGRGTPASASAAFLIGAAPPGQQRLAPLALDRGTRTYRTLAARRLEG